MNTTTKPGVLAVMDTAASRMEYPTASGPGDWRKTHKQLREARATVERLADKADNAEIVLRNAIAAGQISDEYMPILSDLRRELAAFRGDQS